MCCFLSLRLQELLENECVAGLIHVDIRGDGSKLLIINKFADLVPGDTYMLPPTSMETFVRVLGETRHLQQSREAEFARALAHSLQQIEPDQVRANWWIATATQVKSGRYYGTSHSFAKLFVVCAAGLRAKG